MGVHPRNFHIRFRKYFTNPWDFRLIWFFSWVLFAICYLLFASGWNLTRCKRHNSCYSWLVPCSNATPFCIPVHVRSWRPFSLNSILFRSFFPHLIGITDEETHREVLTLSSIQNWSPWIRAKPYFNGFNIMSCPQKLFFICQEAWKKKASSPRR